MMSPQETLLKAAESIAEHGHAKESYFEGRADDWETNPACAYGAMARTNPEKFMYSDGYAPRGFVQTDVIDRTPAADLLAEQIRREHPEFIKDSTYTTITYFNDRPSTTGEDVILMMKKAAHG